MVLTIHAEQMAGCGLAAANLWSCPGWLGWSIVRSGICVRSEGGQDAECACPGDGL